MARERERIDTGRDVRYIRRDDRGRFTTDQVDASRAKAADRRQHAQHTAAHGQGDRGDRRTAERRRD
ncbi:MAG TPA: hypothetical protein VFN41_08815 [Candidatus Limnocylindrales bacterium]|nr:hypothetical protein [Candidatus Limnocylindrales bacterium]